MAKAIKDDSEYTCKARRNRKLYHVYYGMIARCENPNNPKYYLYGGKGVFICKEWRDSYAVFENWAYENGYSDGLTINRINSDKEYSPENCEWLTRSENSAKANVGRHKNKTKLKYAYAISPDNAKIDIQNISKFSRDYCLNRSCVSAALHGRFLYNKSGWKFFSDKNEAVTTIERAITEKDCNWNRVE